MTNYHSPDEKIKLSKRHWVEQAINLAMQQKWEEAVTANRTILETFPTDVDAHNRLGKALTELERYTEALETYQRAAELDPNNMIARKNIQRLSALAVQTPATQSPGTQPAVEERVDPRLFIEEMGKTEVTRLVNIAPPEVLARMTAGDQVYLRPTGRIIEVRNSRNEVLGQLDARLSQRLISLIEGGNKYAAAITSISDNEVKVILREIYKSPSQAGKVSFPPKNIPSFRPYIKEGALLRYNEDEEEEEYEEDDNDLDEDRDYDADENEDETNNDTDDEDENE